MNSQAATELGNYGTKQDELVSVSVQSSKNAQQILFQMLVIMEWHS